ncbi:hypothetical protein AGABI1DRAFT_111042 [Agaricus bisporus var. burnettii JB137-S8]|uniref:DUF7918 domain-containing protein n=1 Tax=Agaricus bisporus var. burnettii (strain JB137-S8 / ATCC MYA-4627 / FGSC 10392) TaxID=597362 RepID=K5XGL2_AGABU|nr:uncharacterized protein AGABI1DRAFT_111042 [Agaricus bisporus var. burnettii JB137-S8]EKM82412.1 hypothetical protein AGABI1DRAFT_111042 [Agaricus bisporus var. burnettii JB137-S8]
MYMLQHHPCRAWITIEGDAAEVYDVQSSGNLVTCWIASEVGKKFAVNWDNLTREFAMKASICIDGLLCDTHIMLDARGFPNKPNSVGVSSARTSDYTRRDFMFAPLNISDDDRLLDSIDNSLDLGIIKIHLYRIKIGRVENRVLEHRSGKQMLEAQVVHERSKKAGSHHVQFGNEYASPAPVIDMVQYKDIDLDSKPYLTFEFKYKPLDLLVANNIAPRALHILSPTPPPSTLLGEDHKSRELSGPDRRTKELKAKRRDRLVLPNFRRRIKHEVIDLT